MFRIVFIQNKIKVHSYYKLWTSLSWVHHFGLTSTTLHKYCEVFHLEKSNWNIVVEVEVRILWKKKLNSLLVLFTHPLRSLLSFSLSRSVLQYWVAWASLMQVNRSIAYLTSLIINIYFEFTKKSHPKYIVFWCDTKVQPYYTSCVFISTEKFEIFNEKCHIGVLYKIKLTRLLYQSMG